MKNTQLVITLGLATISLAPLDNAFAGDQTNLNTLPTIENSTSNADDWAFRVEPFVWLPGIDGTVGALGLSTDVDLSLSDLFSSSGSGRAKYDIEMLFAMEVEARKGRWGVMANAVYLDLDISGSSPSPRHLTADIDFSEFLGDLAVTYRVWEEPKGFLDLYAGARVNSLSLDINARADLIRFQREPSISVSDSETWVDPIIGLRGQWALSEKFFLAGKADIGGFGVSSELLWSAQATAGYQFTKNFSSEIGYSYYDTDYADSGFIYDLAMGGLFLGLNFEF
ncbi:MAG: hypothetical protein V2J20_00285 [Wenzhouxiangella sp.]|jgi:hypothetical protein|nr:hypothetical protein [Wenzhouxiangella sp.]